MRTVIAIILEFGDRRSVAALARDRNAPHKYAWRVEIVLFERRAEPPMSSSDGESTSFLCSETQCWIAGG